jgi:hypothetical protein
MSEATADRHTRAMKELARQQDAFRDRVTALERVAAMARHFRDNQEDGVRRFSAKNGLMAALAALDTLGAPEKPVQPPTPPAAPSTHEPPQTALDGDMAAVDEATTRLSATCDGAGDLLAQLRDPDFRGPMQHCRSWSDLDRLLDEAATEIERLRATKAMALITPTLPDDMRHAADEDDATGNHLQASYLRAGADEIERLRQIEHEAREYESGRTWELTNLRAALT